MSERIEVDIPAIRYTTRWFCYLDLLGFSDRVTSQTIDRILPLYERALQHVQRGARLRSRYGVSYSWFSDTFIIFSQSDSREDFVHIEQAGRHFFRELVLSEIPVRGALTCGDLYTQQKRNVFIGQALIDAYRYGEGQNWIGFLLTPKCVERMARVELPARLRPHYRPVPTRGVLKDGLKGPAYAFSFSDGGPRGIDTYRDRLLAMKTSSSPVVAHKYDLALEFIEQVRAQRS